MNLKGWKLICEYGFSSQIWGRGNERVIVDSLTQELLFSFKKGEEIEAKEMVSKNVTKQ